MKKYISIFLFIVSVHLSVAQVSVTYSLGYGDYKMSDMKDLLNERFSSVKPFIGKIKVLDNFPGYLTHNIDASYHLKMHEMGVTFTYLTTGGKLGYSDYSGEYEEKMTLKGYRMGLFYRYNFTEISLTNSTAITFFGDISPALIISDLTYNGYLRIGDEITSSEEEISGNSTNFSILPQFGIKLKIPYNLSFIISAGYDFNLKGELNNKANTKIDWSGLRAKCGISYTL